MFSKNRVEVFSDAIMGIIIIGMVFNIKIPVDADFSGLANILPILFCYLLSAVFIMIYWIKHLQVFSAIETVNSQLLWANFILLFWMSLIPFVTNWLFLSRFSNYPTVLYGIVLLLTEISYRHLEKTSTRLGENPVKAGNDSSPKQKIFMPLLLTGVICGFCIPFMAFVAYTAAALLWVLPQKHIDSYINR